MNTFTKYITTQQAIGRNRAINTVWWFATGGLPQYQTTKWAQRMARCMFTFGDSSVVPFAWWHNNRRPAPRGKCRTHMVAIRNHNPHNSQHRS